MEGKIKIEWKENERKRGGNKTGRLDALREEGWTVERRSGRLNGRRIIWKGKAKVGRLKGGVEG